VISNDATQTELLRSLKYITTEVSEKIASLHPELALKPNCNGFKADPHTVINTASNNFEITGDNVIAR